MLDRVMKYAPLVFLCLCILYLHARVRTLGYQVEQLMAESLVNAIRDDYSSKLVADSVQGPKQPSTIVESVEKVTTPETAKCGVAIAPVASALVPQAAPETCSVAIAPVASAPLAAPSEPPAAQKEPLPTETTHLETIPEIQPVDEEIDIVAVQKKTNASEAAKLRAALRARGMSCKGSLEELRSRMDSVTEEIAVISS
jgi:hypothetical protein